MELYCVYGDIDGIENGNYQMGIFTNLELAKSELLKFLAEYEYRVTDESEYEFKAVIDSWWGSFYILKISVNILHTHMFTPNKTSNKTSNESIPPKEALTLDLEQIPSRVVNGSKVLQLN